MSKTKKALHVAKTTPDPLAVIFGAVIAILAKLGILSKLDLSPEDIWEIGAYIIMLAAGTRSYVGMRKAPEDAGVPAPAHATSETTAPIEVPGSDAPASDTPPAAAGEAAETDSDAPST